MNKLRCEFPDGNTQNAKIWIDDVQQSTVSKLTIHCNANEPVQVDITIAPLPTFFEGNVVLRRFIEFDGKRYELRDVNEPEPLVCAFCLKRKQSSVAVERGYPLCQECYRCIR